MLRNEPLPKGTYPMFHDIFRCLSVSTPTKLSEEVLFLLIEPDVLFKDASVDVWQV